MPRKIHYILTLMSLLLMGAHISTTGFGQATINNCGTSSSAVMIGNNCDGYLTVGFESGR